MAAKFRVERDVRPEGKWCSAQVTTYALVRSGEGELVRGDDATLMYRICDALNREDEEDDKRRSAGSSYQPDFLKGS